MPPSEKKWLSKFLIREVRYSFTYVRRARLQRTEKLQELSNSQSPAKCITLHSESGLNKGYLIQIELGIGDPSVLQVAQHLPGWQLRLVVQDTHTSISAYFKDQQPRPSPGTLIKLEAVNIIVRPEAEQWDKISLELVKWRSVGKAEVVETPDFNRRQRSEPLHREIEEVVTEAPCPDGQNLDPIKAIKAQKDEEVLRFLSQASQSNMDANRRSRPTQDSFSEPFLTQLPPGQNNFSSSLSSYVQATVGHKEDFNAMAVVQKNSRAAEEHDKVPEPQAQARDSNEDTWSDTDDSVLGTSSNKATAYADGLQGDVPTSYQVNQGIDNRGSMDIREHDPVERNDESLIAQTSSFSRQNPFATGPSIGNHLESSHTISYNEAHPSANPRTEPSTKAPEAYLWNDELPLTFDLCYVPPDQQKLLNNDWSWYPAKVGHGYPKGNIPVTLLKKINEDATEKQKQKEAAVRLFKSESHENSDEEEEADESSSGAQLEWPASSPVDVQSGQPPPSSPAEQSRKPGSPESYRKESGRDASPQSSQQPLPQYRTSPLQLSQASRMGQMLSKYPANGIEQKSIHAAYPSSLPGVHELHGSDASDLEESVPFAAHHVSDSPKNIAATRIVPHGQDGPRPRRAIKGGFRAINVRRSTSRLTSSPAQKDMLVQRSTPEDPNDNMAASQQIWQEMECASSRGQRSRDASNSPSIDEPAGESPSISHLSRIPRDEQDTNMLKLETKDESTTQVGEASTPQVPGTLLEVQDESHSMMPLNKPAATSPDDFSPENAVDPRMRQYGQAALSERTRIFQEHDLQKREAAKIQAHEHQEADGVQETPMNRSPSMMATPAQHHPQTHPLARSLNTVQALPSPSVMPGFSPTMSPLVSHLATVEDVYNLFCEKYPFYQCNLQSFVATCRLLRKSRQPRSVWDDYVVRYQTHFKDFVRRSVDQCLEVPPYDEFYNDSFDEIENRQKVLNQRTLSLAIGESAPSSSVPSPAISMLGTPAAATHYHQPSMPEPSYSTPTATRVEESQPGNASAYQQQSTPKQPSRETPKKSRQSETVEQGTSPLNPIVIPASTAPTGKPRRSLPWAGTAPSQPEKKQKVDLKRGGSEFSKPQPPRASTGSIPNSSAPQVSRSNTKKRTHLDEKVTERAVKPRLKPPVPSNHAAQTDGSNDEVTPSKGKQRARENGVCQMQIEDSQESTHNLTGMQRFVHGLASMKSSDGLFGSIQKSEGGEVYVPHSREARSVLEWSL